MRLIDADALKEKINVIQCTYGDKGEPIVDYALDEVIDIIDNANVVDPVIHATWNEREDDYADRNPIYYIWECSNCGFDAKREGPKWKYCPNCGAKMVKGEL